MALDRTLPDQMVCSAQYPSTVAVLWHLMEIVDCAALSIAALMVCRPHLDNPCAGRAKS